MIDALLPLRDLGLIPPTWTPTRTGPVVARSPGPRRRRQPRPDPWPGASEGAEPPTVALFRARGREPQWFTRSTDTPVALDIGGRYNEIRRLIWSEPVFRAYIRKPGIDAEDVISEVVERLIRYQLPGYDSAYDGSKGSFSKYIRNNARNQVLNLQARTDRIACSEQVGRRGVDGEFGDAREHAVGEVEHEVDVEAAVERALEFDPDVDPEEVRDFLTFRRTRGKVSRATKAAVRWALSDGGG